MDCPQWDSPVDYGAGSCSPRSQLSNYKPHPPPPLLLLPSPLYLKVCSGCQVTAPRSSPSKSYWAWALSPDKTRSSSTCPRAWQNFSFIPLWWPTWWTCWTGWPVWRGSLHWTLLHANFQVQGQFIIPLLAAMLLPPPLKAACACL